MKKLDTDIASCRLCPRLVNWREHVAVEKRASFRDEQYWGKPVSGFGDPTAHLLVMGLAPAAHGANRTGRMFTGDRSGDWLYRAMHRAGFANQETSRDARDGLVLIDAWVTSAVRCAPPDNKPLPEERDACSAFLDREIALLPNVGVVVCLGSFAYVAASAQFGIRPRPKFGHGVEAVTNNGITLLCSYHSSQQNTFTGTLTESMLDDVFSRAKSLVAK